MSEKINFYKELEAGDTVNVFWEVMDGEKFVGKAILNLQEGFWYDEESGMYLPQWWVKFPAGTSAGRHYEGAVKMLINPTNAFVHVEEDSFVFVE